MASELERLIEKGKPQTTTERTIPELPEGCTIHELAETLCPPYWYARVDANNGSTDYWAWGMTPAEAVNLALAKLNAEFPNG